MTRGDRGYLTQALVLALVLVALKLTQVINWSWWWIASPLAGGAAVVLLRRSGRREAGRSE
jgi:hypothetical protein